MQLRHIPLVLFLAIGLITVISFVKSETTKPSISTRNAAMPTSPYGYADEAKVIGRFTYDLIPLEGKKVALYPNHDTKLSSSELVAKYECESATSGSFYGLDDKPIGLFISEGRQIQSESSSDLFIGFLSSVDGERMAIGRVAPTRVAWALQSGPIVWDGGPTSIRLKSDKSARRIVAAVDTSGRGYLIVLHTIDSIHDGPLLTELGQLVADIGDREKISVETALNLDGGFHSFFIHTDTRLHALATPGSVICVK
ncbi:MAG: phosphodiester glycosidase family protein [bacterium]